MAHALKIDSTLPLNSGHSIPILGFGVYKTPEDEATKICMEALKTGYRHIDSAKMYNNQGPSAASIAKSGISRSDVFFTTKVFDRADGTDYDTAKAQVEAALEETKLDYLDLVLIHAPHGTSASRKGTWKALVEYVEAGKIRSIGVSNYGVHHLNELEQHIKELEEERGGAGKGGVISVGQWEVHPWLCRQDIVDWCTKRNIVVEAYCPIVRAQRFDEPGVQKLAKKYSRTPAQVLLRWCVQRKMVALVKTATPSRVLENASLFDFELTEDEIKELATDEYSPCAWDPTTMPL